MPTAAFHTLGCKVNQYETEKIRQELEALGFETVPYPGPADTVVVNTCTVTGTADAKSRSAVRRAVRHSPGAVVVATGCGVETQPALFACIEGVRLIVPNRDKESVAARIASMLPLACRNGGSPVRPRVRTRAVVKVQDGCNQFCTYCVVPYVRKESFCREADDVLSEIRSLTDFGYKEVVLAGIRLGSYESDGVSLPELLLRVAEVDGVERVRLSSVEVWEISRDLIEAMKHPKVCRHLHIPLQSADDELLKAMGRPYTAGSYAEVLEEARNAIDGLAVTTDVMAGFPGETEEAFCRSRDFVAEMRFARLHVFRYSRRPGTRASALPGQVPAQVKARRSADVVALGKQLAQEFADGLIGKRGQVLVEARTRATGLLSGLTDNYVEVEFCGPESLRGQIVELDMTERRDDVLMGNIVQEVSHCQTAFSAR